MARLTDSRIRLHEIFQSERFRLSAFFALAAVGLTLVLFAFIYWQTAGVETRRIDRFLAVEAMQLSREPEDELQLAVATRMEADFHRVNFVGLFTAGGAYLSGNLPALPPGVAADGVVHEAAIVFTRAPLPDGGSLRLVERRLADGRILAIGRNVFELKQLRQVVLRALLLGLLPALVLSLVVGGLLSIRALSRARSMDRTLGHIMRGDLGKRLKVGSGGDSLDHLSRSVNLALDEIDRLVGEIRSVGDAIAHDLRTPLSRLRGRLELYRSQTGNDPDLLIERSLADLDRAFALITAILRIGEIESGRRRAGFQTVEVNAVCTEIFELYEPLAEAKGIALALTKGRGMTVFADREMLLETMANLIENAIKFTPDGGRVALAVLEGIETCTLRVSDTGPGVPEGERAAILGRFYRSDPRRIAKGHGLGLSIVAAIARLHGFELAVGGNRSGAVFELICPLQRPPDASH